MASNNNQSTGEVPAEGLERTISLELFQAWQRLKRKGDPMKMAARFGMSRFPFDNALNFGYVAKDDTATFVNTFFKERLEEEKKSATELNALADAIEQINQPSAK